MCQSHRVGLAEVREHIPLEHGLRLSDGGAITIWQRQRAYSIRTRIKTMPLVEYQLSFDESESIFH